MRAKIENYNTIANNLKINYPKLTDYEILSIAVQIERNQILENGLAVYNNDEYAGGLEAIAISLGYGNEIGKRTITEVLSDISDKE